MKPYSAAPVNSDAKRKLQQKFCKVDGRIQGKHTTYQHPWRTTKVVLRDNAYILKKKDLSNKELNYAP